MGGAFVAVIDDTVDSALTFDSAERLVSSETESSANTAANYCCRLQKKKNNPTTTKNHVIRDLLQLYTRGFPCRGMKNLLMWPM